MRNANLARRAEGLTEYVIVVVLVAMAGIAAVKEFGWRVEEAQLNADVQVFEMEK